MVLNPLDSGSGGDSGGAGGGGGSGGGGGDRSKQPTNRGRAAGVCTDARTQARACMHTSISGHPLHLFGVCAHARTHVRTHARAHHQVEVVDGVASQE